MRENKRCFGVLTVIALVVIMLIAGCGGGSGSSNGTGNSNSSGGAITPTGITLPNIPNRTFKITDYGASTGSSDNTTDIQAAIDACAKAGGGTVVIPSGTFLCGPLTLKSNMNLQISNGATLKLLAYGIYPGSGSTADVADFLYGSKISNVEISGSGTIEGQGSAWWTAFKATKGTSSEIARPCIIRFDGCTNIEITGITIQNAPNVHITIGKKSSSTTVSNVTINSPSSSPNTDGIDTWSRNIYITKCNISCGDDNIAMNRNEDGYTSDNITITDCTFGLGHGCSIGSYAANIYNVTVDNCTFTGTENGIRLKSNNNSDGKKRGGVVYNLSYSNITMTKVETPITIVSYYPDSNLPNAPAKATKEEVTEYTPNWHNITFKNIVATGSDNAGVFWGRPELYIGANGGVIFDTVSISATSGMTAYYVAGFTFKNSTITVSSGKAITTYNASISGINNTTGSAN
jgi:polygalacturonase